MTTMELDSRLQAIIDMAKTASPMVTGVSARRFTDSTGDDAVQFDVELADPPGGVVRYLEVEPVQRAIRRMAADLGLVVYVGFTLASEQRQIEADTHYDHG